MNTTELLTIFSDPQRMMSLSFSEKMGGVLITTVLGMGITFLALVFIMYLIDMMTKALQEKPAAVSSEKTVAATEVEEIVEELVEELVEEENQEELVAAITAAISLQLGGKRKFVVTNIEKVQDNDSTWGKMGIVEQLSSRF